jgi:hypothetical protein
MAIIDPRKEDPRTGRPHRNRGGITKGDTMTRKDLNVLLAERETSLRQWAIKNGYRPGTVTQVVNRYLSTDRKPRGRESYAILRGLSKDLGKEIVPGILQPDDT